MTRTPRRRLLAALAVALAAPFLAALPSSPAGAADPVRYVWTTLADGQHLTFDPTKDVLEIDAPIYAAQARISQAGPDLAFTAAGKTVYLDGMRLGQLRLQAIYFKGAAPSALVVGDNVPVEWDTDGRVSSINVSGFTDNQMISLGGPTRYIAGPGKDRMVGAPAIRALTHLSRTADVGSPTPTHLPAISGTGKKVVFEGGWTGFLSPDNSATDIIVRDVDAGTFTNEHRDLAGQAGRSGSGAPRISADGNFVVFASTSQLVTVGTPSNTIFRADTRNNDVVVVSADSTGTAYANASAATPDVSSDGRYVVFSSGATNLAVGSAGSIQDVFLKDLVTGSVTRISTGQGGGDANADAISPRISDDGNYVTFASSATNLTDLETGGGATDIYVWARSDGSLNNLSVGGTGTGSSRNPDVSNGGAVAFESDKSLVAADTDGFTDVYVGWAGIRTLVSQTATGGQVTLGSGEPSISATGRWVAFRGFSDLLVPGDTNGYSDIFVVDTTTKEIALVSRTAAAQANQSSSRPSISADGFHIAFESGASNLSALDANGSGSDVFVVGNPTIHSELEGGLGDDRYVLDPAGYDRVIEATGGGTDTLEARVTGTYVLPTNVENFLGTTGNDRVTGNAGNNRLDPGAGSDTMFEGAGNDTFVISASTDIIGTGTDAAGTDTVETLVTWTLGSLLENLKLTGSAAINGTGNTGANVMTGNSAANILKGEAGADTYTGGTGADTFTVDTSTSVDTVNDFEVGTDQFRMRQSAWRLGDGDLLVEGATRVTGPGGFSRNAEYVIVTKRVSSFTTTNASSVIGSATSAYATGSRRIFVVNDGTSSQAYLFIAANADAKVSASELKPLMLFRNRSNLSVRSLLLAT